MGLNPAVNTHTQAEADYMCEKQLAFQGFLSDHVVSYSFFSLIARDAFVECNLSKFSSSYTERYQQGSSTCSFLILLLTWYKTLALCFVANTEISQTKAWSQGTSHQNGLGTRGWREISCFREAWF